MTKAAILSPGDRYEFKISVEVGDTLMASVTSDTFDPALELATPSGQVLAKNDDREDGDQSPFIAYHFDKAGEYTLKVVGYRSTSGGKFTISTKQFHPVDALPGVATSLRPTSDQIANRELSLRIHAKKGTVYDLGHILNAYGAPLSPYAMVGPTGVGANDFDLLHSRDYGWVFRALADGDYYCQFGVYDNANIKISVDEVRSVSMPTDQTQTLSLSPKSALILEIPVKKNSSVRTTFSSKDVDSATRLIMGDHSTPPSRPNSDGQIYGTQPGYLWLRTAKNSDQDVIRLFQQDGTETITVRNTKDKPVTFTVKNTSTLPELASDKSVSESIKIGECKYYLMKTTKSDLLRIEASSDSFEPAFRIIGFDGTVGPELIDPVHHRPNQNIFYQESNTYVVRLSCDGNGGSGIFSLRRLSAAAKPYALGSVATPSMRDERFELYCVDLDAGARYQLVTNDVHGSIEIIGDSGDYVPRYSNVFGTLRVSYLVAPYKGRYRIWVKEASVQDVKFTLQPYSLPSLDR